MIPVSSVSYELSMYESRDWLFSAAVESKQENVLNGIVINDEEASETSGEFPDCVVLVKMVTRITNRSAAIPGNAGNP